MPTFAPRLHVLLAPKARKGLVLRRGPSRYVAAIGWDLDTNRFSLGQWLRGRIYERRSDLSPDGEHFLYFAMNGHWKSRARGSWTAVSRAPFLAAVALYAKGDCWHGGGLFLDRDTYWLNDGYGHELLGETGEVRRAENSPYRPEWGGECFGVYFNRLHRDGWVMRPELGTKTPRASTVVFDKPASREWTLRKFAKAMLGAPPGKGVYHDSHMLIHSSGEELPFEKWEWADLDGKTLLWAEGGKLWSGKLGKKRDKALEETRMISDFSEMKFEAREAPYEKVDPDRGR